MKEINTHLLHIINTMYIPLQFDHSEITVNKEGQEYAACSFTLNKNNIQFRVGKITPKKIGQFVTVWKRNSSGITAPHDTSDNVDFFAISADKDNNQGHFIFPKSVLIEKNIFSKDGKDGKRGIRIYPPWEKAVNKQAQKTQEWQLNYFINTTDQNNIDFEFIKKLYSL